MAHVLTLTGPSGAGKSTLIHALLDLHREGFEPIVIPKHTTRPPRKGESGKAIRSKRFRETISCKKERDGKRKLPRSCDLVYEQYGVRYGLHLRDVYECLAQGKSPIIILNDVRAVEDIRNALGPLVRSLFLFRERPDIRKHESLARERGGTDAEAVRKRFDKAQSIYRIYIENIHLFDHVVLNHGAKTDLSSQASQIVAGLTDNRNWPLTSASVGSLDDE